MSNVDSSIEKENSSSEIRSFYFALNSTKLSFLVGLSYTNPYITLMEAKISGSDEVLVDDYLVFNEISNDPKSLKIGQRVPF
jgi:hypothetical protein